MNEQAVDNSDRELVDSSLGSGSIDFSVDDSFSNVGDDSGKRKFNASSILFGCVVMASVLSLWSMRTLGRSDAGMIGAGDAVQEVREWVWARSNDGDSVSLGELEIIDRLDKEHLNTLQIPLGEIGNQFPFRYQGEGIHDVKVSAVEDTPEINLREKMMSQWNETINVIGEQMKVTAILAPDSSRAQAVLNGQRLMLGDVFYIDYMDLEYAFQVERITQDGLVFVIRNSELRHELRIKVGVDHGW